MSREKEKRKDTQAILFSGKKKADCPTLCIALFGQIWLKIDNQFVHPGLNLFKFMETGRLSLCWKKMNEWLNHLWHPFTTQSPWLPILSSVFPPSLLVWLLLSSARQALGMQLCLWFLEPPLGSTISPSSSLGRERQRVPLICERWGIGLEWNCLKAWVSFHLRPSHAW